MSPVPAGLSSKAFRYLWAATGGANLADGVLIAAAPLLAATLTRDPLLVAALIIAQRLPWLLFTLPSGVIVDRLDRRHVMIAANGLRGIAVALLAVYVAVGSGGLLVLYAVAFLVGIAETLADNAAIAILPPLVDDTDLRCARNWPTAASATS